MVAPDGREQTNHKGEQSQFVEEVFLYGLPEQESVGIPDVQMPVLALLLCNHGCPTEFVELVCPFQIGNPPGGGRGPRGLLMDLIELEGDALRVAGAASPSAVADRST